MDSIEFELDPTTLPIGSEESHMSKHNLGMKINLIHGFPSRISNSGQNHLVNYRKLVPQVTDHVVDESIGGLRSPGTNGEDWKQVIVQEIISPYHDREDRFVHQEVSCL